MGRSVLLKKTRGNFFFPSPSANLVGVVKKSQKKFYRYRCDFVCTSCL